MRKLIITGLKQIQTTLYSAQQHNELTCMYQDDKCM